jgi:hypothetical protein
MPPQKNSGTKAQKRESGTTKKNNRFVNDLLSDLMNGEDMNDIYVARISKKFGNGRFEIEYYTKDGVTNQTALHTKQAIIPGRFRGKGKHAVWIDVGSVVALGDAGVGAELTVMAVLTRQQLKEIGKSMYIDERIMNSDSTNSEQAEDGFEFQEEKPEEELKDDDIDHI